MKVQVETVDGTIHELDIVTSFDILELDQALAICAALGEDEYRELLAGTVTEKAFRALIWVQLQKAGIPVMWEDMEQVAV